MEVMYIANEGFLIKASNKKILIDGLFGKFESDWCDVPSGDVIEKMERCIKPFDQIDVILVSHAHVDHFNADIVAKHLENNIAGILICPRQVAQALGKNEKYAKISPRVTEITPDDETSIKIDAKGMEIKVWRLVHAPYYVENEETGEKQNVHEDVQNLGFTIEIDGKRIFHSGDWVNNGAGKKKNPLLEERRIDIAFLNARTYRSLYDACGKIIDEHNKPPNIILMHLLPEGKVEDITDEEKKAFSDVTIFKSSMESKCFNK